MPEPNQPSSPRPSPSVARRSNSMVVGREEMARAEIGQTTVRPATAAVLAAFFLVVIVVVPIVELVGTYVRPTQGRVTPWAHLSRVPGDMRSFLAGKDLRGGSEQGASAERSGAWKRIVSANRIVLAGLSGFEHALENDSLIGQSLRPRAQVVMTGWLGAGNERVYPGLDRWLFYRQDVEYVTGRGFLDSGQIRRRIEEAPEWTAPPQPDPRVAIAQLRDDLAARGIALVVVPTPVKPAVHPEMLARRYAGATGVLQNPSYRDFVDDVRRHGVHVFDPSESLAAARRSGPQYLATDSHWRPESMEAVAELVGEVVASQGRLAATADPGYRVERVEVRHTGDVARMLDVSADATLFPPEAVWLRRILQPDGSRWRSSRDAEVLVLGDSFSNVYTLESMGWGTSAGFVEQLSYVLRRPIDRLVQNDRGAFATREMLQRDPARLDGKRVVVYQFAVRELMFGDWKVMRLPTAR